MHADALPGAKAIGKPGNKGSEGLFVGRKVVIGHWMGQKLQSNPLCQGAFFQKIKPAGLFLIQERNEGFDAAALHGPQFVAKPPINRSMRSRTLGTARPRAAPSSMSGISLSNSGPECVPVSAIRTGRKRSLPLTPVAAFTSFIQALKTSGVTGLEWARTRLASSPRTMRAESAARIAAFSSWAWAASGSKAKTGAAFKGSWSRWSTAGTRRASRRANQAWTGAGSAAGR